MYVWVLLCGGGGGVGWGVVASNELLTDEGSFNEVLCTGLFVFVWHACLHVCVWVCTVGSKVVHSNGKSHMVLQSYWWGILVLMLAQIYSVWVCG